MSRHAARAIALPLLLIAHAARAEPPERIDILVDPVPRQAVRDEDCQADREAAVITGEIVVCGEREQALDQRLYDDEQNENRYARETMDKDNPAPPDVTGEYVFKGPPTVSGLCILAKCPPPPAYFVDVAALPDAPAGSDADRVAQGLPPLGSGSEAGTPPEVAQDELGLPPSRYASSDEQALGQAGG